MNEKKSKKKINCTANLFNQSCFSLVYQTVNNVSTYNFM